MWVQTPWSTFRKIFLTNEMIDFAVLEFNHYPKTLAARRTRPPYIPKNKSWPPKWVNETGRTGPMELNRHQFLKYICILYLLGVKRLQDTNLEDLFSVDPIMREDWLRDITNKNDMQRFLRQVYVRVMLCFNTLSYTICRAPTPRWLPRTQPVVANSFVYLYITVAELMGVLVIDLLRVYAYVLASCIWKIQRLHSDVEVAQTTDRTAPRQKSRCGCKWCNGHACRTYPETRCRTTKARQGMEAG